MADETTTVILKFPGLFNPSYDSDGHVNEATLRFAKLGAESIINNMHNFPADNSAAQAISMAMTILDYCKIRGV